jgi:hypothetical protein
MRNLYRSVITAVLLCICTGAFAQQSSLLAKCLGEPLSVYGKAFGDATTSQRKTSEGAVTVGDYKTGSAAIEVIQKSGAKLPDVITAYFYQEPARDWKLALKDLGLSSNGVTAKEDSKHQVRLTGIKAGKSLHVEALFIPIGPGHTDGPELHIKLK